MKSAINFVEVGVCKVDIEIAKKKWNMLHRIVKHQEKYQLLEYTPKGETKLKVVISKEDAICLIRELNLIYVPSKLFNESGVYLKV